MKRWSCVLGFLSGFIFASSALAAPWNLPQQLTGENLEIKFDVDTTWHTVHGHPQSVAGKAWLSDPKDFRSVAIDLRLPVNGLDTANKSRDAELYQDMDQATFPEIHFLLSDAENICNPASLKAGESCEFVGHGALTIRDVTKQLAIPAKIESHTDGSYAVIGSTRFRWLDFGIKDPSIFIARVKPNVDVRFELHLPAKE